MTYVTNYLTLTSLVVLLPVFLAGAIWVIPASHTRTVVIAGAVVSVVGASWLALKIFESRGVHRTGEWIVFDPLAGILVLIVGALGITSILFSDTYLRGLTSGVVSQPFRTRLFYSVLLVFWAMLYAVPLAGNLGAAWLLIEGTTATSALLVGFSGKPRALEAGWKYLILTSAGMGVALLGIALLGTSSRIGGLGGLSWSTLSRSSGSHPDMLVAFVLVVVGLASKVGWAPVHNWLPDAHSEAPSPISGLLSGALLPCVLAVTWRTTKAMSPVVGTSPGHEILIGFGILSLAMAVPFLWQPLAWKRLLAYSSLEHMGIIALGIGFGGPLAIAGVIVHLFGHAIAKSLGFYASQSLLTHDPRSAKHPPGGVGRSSPKLGATLGISLATLSGFPPLPLFVSEVLILAGGFENGYLVASILSALLIAFGFIGLLQALLSTLLEDHHGSQKFHYVKTSPIFGLAILATVFLLIISWVGLYLPSSSFVHRLVSGMG